MDDELDAHAWSKAIAAGHGPALLAFGARPTRSVAATMVSCALNLGRHLTAATGHHGSDGAITTEHDIAAVATAVRSSGAAIVVAAGVTRPAIIRRLAAAVGRPVLVARARERWHRVLGASDLVVPGLPVFTMAAAVAAASGSEPWLALHNIEPRWAPPTLAPATVGARSTVERLRRLARVAARARATVMVTSAGSAHRGILDAARVHDADLVVLGMGRPEVGDRRRCADWIFDELPGNILAVPIAPRRGRPASAARA